VSFVDVVVDAREASARRRARRERVDPVAFLRARGLRVGTALLPCGDIYVPPPREGELGIVVEIKYVTDLLNAVRDARLGAQLARLRSARNAVPYLAVWGYLGVVEKLGLRWAPSAVMRLLESVQRRGVRLLLLPRYEHVLGWVAQRAAELSRNRVSSPPLDVDPEELEEEPGERALLALEGVVGPKTARALLRRFGTLLNLIEASPEDLANTIVTSDGKRFGKRAEELWRILHEPYAPSNA